ncbi:MAG: Mu transposase C-terminal domain-containing protein [Nitrobacter sp.]
MRKSLCASIAPTAVRDDGWLQAQRYARELGKVLDGDGPRRVAIARAAAELGLTTRQIYNLLKRYASDRSVRALLPQQGRTRRKRLAPEVEAIIAATLREQWLVLEAPPLAPVVAEIRARCEEAGRRPPCHVAVERRIPLLFTAQEIAKGRSANAKHLHRLKPRPGYIHAPRPLDVCQIDHTPTDINFVDVIDGIGVFVGRAYLTLLVDVCTRAIVGFCLTLEKPSTLSVALCLAQAMCAKDEWLRARGLVQCWPVFGRPRRLVTDSAKEFKGHAFQRGCDDYGVTIRYRDRGRVHQGGVVERLLGKLNAVIATRYGSTGRSVTDRDGYPSRARACLTFADLETCLALAIIDHNQQQNDKTLKVPLAQWQAQAVELPRFHDDPHRVLLNFLPVQWRVLTPQGISLFAMTYYAPWLGRLVPERDRIGKLEVRYDPRDISHVYVRDPHSDDFLPVARRDGVTTPLTLWEHIQHRGDARAAHARSDVEKVAIRRQIAGIAESARQKKAVLRQAVRAAHAAAGQKPYQAKTPQAPAPPQHPLRQKRRLPVEEW